MHRFNICIFAHQTNNFIAMFERTIAMQWHPNGDEKIATTDEK